MATLAATFHIQGASSTQSAQYRCPCCHSRTINHPAAMELCPVCWWEDDGQDDSDAAQVRFSVNGELSLAEARSNFALCAAAHQRFARFVRKPSSTEK